MMRKIISILRCVCFLFLLLGLILYPNEIKKSVYDTLIYCMAVLTPSLFPFMALVCYAASSQISDVFGRLLGGVTRYVFRLPAGCTAVIILSLVGGYPSGAKGVSLLLEREVISEEEASRMMTFCVAPGIAFVVTFVGGGILGSFSLGWILFFSVTIGSVILGVISSFGKAVPEKENAVTVDSSDAIMKAVRGASEGVITMCACILLFAGFNTLLHCTGIFQRICEVFSRVLPFTPMETSALLTFITEVTGGTGAAAGFRVSPVFFAFGLGFGGLCVHMQVLSFFKNGLPHKGRFFLFRFLHGCLSSAICALLLKVFPSCNYTPAWAPTDTGNGFIMSGNPAGGLSLLLMCAAFLIITAKNQENC